ncbi:MAG: TonB-dependent receptor [Cyclobacteriaceae bacterium]|nr:TonB-dependent receptor [Cyclobacteriaceae bacterium]
MRRILLFIAVFTFSFGLYAQERVVSGKVTSADDGSTLPGVNVVLKGTTTGTVTDTDGNYKLSVPESGGTLVFSFVGLTTIEVGIGSRSVVDVQMASDFTQLNEVVVTDSYQSIKRAELSGAVGSVGGKVIENLPIPSLDRALQGRIAGVQINSSNGVPGGNTQVRIRGVGSISGSNEPLYIVDGVQITAGDRSRRIISSNVLNGINSNDIENIEVLKDAAAASIYGAQAANGVVIITTKKGKSGAVKFNANYYYGTSDVIRKQPLINSKQWMDLYQEGQANFYQPYNSVFGEGFNTEIADLVTEVNYGNSDAANTYDWQDLVTQRGVINNFDFSASGGNEKNRFFVSASVNKQEAQFIATDFTRSTFKVNYDNQLSKKLSSSLSLNMSVVKQNTQGVGGFNTNNALVGAIGRLPMANPYLTNGQINPNLTYAIGPLGNLSNPLWLAQVNPQQGSTKQLLANYSVNYAINNDLTFKSAYAIEYTVIDEWAFFDSRSPAGSAAAGLAQMFNTRVVNWSTDQTINYVKTFNDKHNINAVGGFSFREQKLDGFNATGQGVSNNEFKRTLVGTTPNVVNSVYGIFKLSGLFARAVYSYDEKYVATVTVRRDGSSRFGDGRKFGIFPSISAAWNIHRENFMNSLGFINELKLRASFGRTGNQDIGADFPISLYGGGAAFAYNGGGGLSFTNLGNPQLQWETNETINFGLDFSLLKGRITATTDYFIRNTKNLLLPQVLPSNSGFATIIENVGTLQNRGLELGISTVNIDGAFKWTTDFNVTFIKNEVTKLLRDGEDLPNNGLWVGRPLGQAWTARYAGVNPADGRAMWYDANNNITYDPQANDRVFLSRGSGSFLLPDYYGGFTNTFTYKGFEVSAFFQFNIGQLAASNFKANSSMDYRFDTAQDEEMLERWQKPGDITDVPRIIPGAQEVGSANSLFGGAISGHDRFTEDASYLRLKQLSIAYTLPASLVSRLKLSSARVYLQGVNLWTLTEFTGLDPEFAANTSNIGVLPPSQGIIAGVQFGF